jgi:alpha-tubulin suppressor-like RCC1 family protein
LPLVALLLAWAVPVALPVAAGAEQASQPTSAAAGGIDAGAFHTCVIVNSGSLRCWGYSAEGELGYGNTNTIGDTQTPASAGPVDLGSGRTAKAISAGDYHTCALLDDGSVRCWGYGAAGRLGYGNTDNVGDTQAPGSVGPVNFGSGHTATAIAAGGAHTCAILDDGSVRCWGYGATGQLGYGNTSNVGDGSPDLSVASVGRVDLGPGRIATAISAGAAHTCAILDHGNVLCWGFGGFGQLGYGTRDNVGDNQTPGSMGPVNLGLGRTAVAITAGGQHTCAILDNGTVRCWGYNGLGQLGYGNTTNVGSSSTPDTAGPVDIGAGRTARAITAGQLHTCALLDDGTVRCWGFGNDGRLGYGNTNSVGDVQTPGSFGPVALGAGHSAVAITAGQSHTCARLDDGSVRCWGAGALGRLGYCTDIDVGATPATTPDMIGPVNLMPSDGGALCAVTAPVVVNVSVPSISGQTIAGRPLTEGHGAWSPAPTNYGYQWEHCDAAGGHCGAIAGAGAQTYTPSAINVGSTIRVVETASAGGASAAAESAPTAVITAAPVSNPDAGRKRGWRRCLAAVSARARHARALTHRGSKRQRARTRRRLARQLAGGRQRCVKRWGRRPGQVNGLHAITRGKTEIELEFTAPGTDGNNPPAATSYLIKQSSHPIRDHHSFTAAQALCKGACRFTVTKIATKIKLTVTALHPRSIYYYAVAARDNVTGQPGRRSRTVMGRTR